MMSSLVLGFPFPPSSTFSLLRRNSNARAAVLAEYDDRYIDPFYGGAWDSGVDAVDPARMARVAVVLAKTLLNVAAGFPPGSAQLARATEGVDGAGVDATTRELVTCLVDPAVGFDCGRARALFSHATGRWSSRYAGVLPGLLAKDHQNPLGKSDVQRFVWNFLANATADRDLSSFKSCASQEECGGGDVAEVCVGATGDRGGFLGRQERLRSKRRRLIEQDERRGDASRLGADDGTSAEPGACVAASVGFVPALSHRLAFDATELIWRLGAPDPTELALGGGEDPVWTESNWPGSVGITAYVHEGEFRDGVIFFSGLAVAIGSWWYIRRLDRWYTDLEQTEWGRAPYNWVDTGPPPTAARESTRST